MESQDRNRAIIEWFSALDPKCVAQLSDGRVMLGPFGRFTAGNTSPAQAIEARSGQTEGLDPKGEIGL